MEIDARRLYLREGCSSLFTYGTQVLHFAEGAACNRIEAARVGRRYPIALTALAEGSVTLTTIRLLAPHLTEDNGATWDGLVRRAHVLRARVRRAEYDTRREAVTMIRHPSWRQLVARVASRRPAVVRAVPFLG